MSKSILTAASALVTPPPRPTIPTQKWLRIVIEELAGTPIDLVACIWDIKAVNPQDENFLTPALVVPSASTSYPGSYTAANAIDGNLGTRWQSSANNGRNSWVRFNQQNPVNISDIVISTPPIEQWHTDYPARCPRNFRIETSANGTSGWTLMKRFENVTGWVPGQVRKFSLVD